MVQAVTFKCQNYQQRCNEKGYDFTPFAMDIYGAIGRSCHGLITRIAASLADKNDETIGLVKEKNIQRLVAVVQKGVILALQSRDGI